MPRFETNQVRAGYSGDPTTHAFVTPIFQTAAYGFESTQHAADLFALKEPGNIYSRIMNPTVAVLEERVASLDGGVGALAFASGHGALVSAITTLMGQGGHIVAGATLYGGTINLLTHTMPALGITTTFVDTDNPRAMQAALRDETRLVLVEAIGNPGSNLCDTRAIADIAHEAGIPLLVDATFCTPYLYRPLEHGADIVLHSATKYLGGHGSTMGGILVDGGTFPWDNGKFPSLSEPDPSYHDGIHTQIFGKAAFIGRARVAMLRDLGACLSPFNAFMLLQGVETLSLRMERHVENARKLIAFLQEHSAVDRVYYPEAASSPYKALAQRDWPRGCGGIFSIDIKGGRQAGGKLIDSFKLFSNVANVADVRSMVIHPASTTHSQLSDAQLKAGGVGAGLVRVSVGIEHIEDIIEDFAQALDASQA